MTSYAHRRLRDATQVDHQRLEDSVDILRRIETPQGRRGLVESFSGLHADAEAALAPWLATLPGLDFDARRRSVQLAQDLVVVGGVAPAPQPMAVRSTGEALGLMYVLEGSTLGGRVIRRQVNARGGDMAGLSFLDPYGEGVGARWQGFLAVLGDHGADADAMVDGALAGFRYAEDRLRRDGRHG